MKEFGFDSVQDLDEYLKKIEKSLTRARNKELGIEEVESKVNLFSPFLLLSLLMEVSSEIIIRKHQRSL